MTARDICLMTIHQQNMQFYDVFVAGSGTEVQRGVHSDRHQAPQSENSGELHQVDQTQLSLRERVHLLRGGVRPCQPPQPLHAQDDARIRLPGLRHLLQKLKGTRSPGQHV